MDDGQPLVYTTMAGIKVEITKDSISVNGVDHRLGASAIIDPNLVFPSIYGSFIVLQIEDVPILLTFASESLFSDEIPHVTSVVSAVFSLNEKYFFILTKKNSICMFKTIDCQFIGESYFKCLFKPKNIEFIEAYRFFKITSDENQELILDAPASLFDSLPRMPATLHESVREVKQLFITEKIVPKSDISLPKPDYPHTYPSNINQAALDVYEKSKDAAHRKYTITMRRNALIAKTKELQHENQRLQQLKEKCEQRTTDLLSRVLMLVMQKENFADVKTLEDQMYSITTKWSQLEKSFDVVDRGTALDIHQCRFNEKLDQIEKVIGHL